MHIFRTLARKARSQLLSSIFTRDLILGEQAYPRRWMLPNLLSKSLRHEMFLDDIFHAVLKSKTGCVIDVGVNTGQTLFKVLATDKHRDYFGFEPQSMAAACVESFLIENKLSHCTILPVALSDRNGIIPIHIRGDGIKSMASSSASIVDGFRPGDFYHYKKYIYAARGDEIVPSLGIRSMALIKIDVEGAELEVVKGLPETIKLFRPFILFEVLHHYLVVTDEELAHETIIFREKRIEELEALIRVNDYRIYQIHGRTGLVRIDKIQPRVVNDLSSTDFIAIPNENEQGFCQSLSATRTITSTASGN